MALTVKTTNSVTTGISYATASNGDTLYVAPGIVWGSTDNFAVNATHNDVNLTIEGSVLAGGVLSAFNFAGERAYLTIAETGSATTHAISSGIGGVYFGGDGNFLSNSGEINALQTIAVLSQGSSSVNNSGVIRGSSGVFFIAEAGSQLINSGLIEANAWQDAERDTRFNNGVMGEEANTDIVNLETGVISAVSVAGAGVRLRGTADGSYVDNHGEITSLQWYGVDFSDLSASNTARLTSSGTISGGAGAFIGSINDDTVQNTGLMNGRLGFAGGDDSLRNGGIINGNVNLGNGIDSYTGFAGGAATSVDGKSGDDTLIGSAANDVFDGGDDSDTLRGRGGDDTLVGGTGSDELIGGSGDDRLEGGISADRLIGGIGADDLFGDGGDDVLRGGSGDDTLDGGLGIDQLSGGSGTDRFVFSNVTHSPATPASDRIVDFQRGADLIDLSGVASGLTFIGTTTFSATAGEVRYAVNANGHARVLVDVDGDAGTDMRIWVNDTNTLSESDFVF